VCQEKDECGLMGMANSYGKSSLWFRTFRVTVGSDYNETYKKTKKYQQFQVM
jgi:hypothetical protein